MKQIVEVLSARYVDFEDKESKRPIKGVSMEFVQSLQPQESEDGRLLGSPVCKAWLRESLWDKLRVVPGAYMTDMDISIVAGKMQAKIVDINYAGNDAALNE